METIKFTMYVIGNCKFKIVNSKLLYCHERTKEEAQLKFTRRNAEFKSLSINQDVFFDVFGS